MSDSTPQNAALAQLLEARMVAWNKAHEPQKEKLLECYSDAMRIARDNDTKGTGLARSKSASGIFIGSTRNKVRAARAKINDALFGNGKFPFDTSPVNEDLKQFSDCVEEILSAQLKRMGAKKLLKAGVDTLATFGTGFIVGPLVRKECLYQTTADMSTGTAEIKETKFEYDHPYFDLINTLDADPDPEARVMSDGLGLFWTTMESRHTVEAWKQDPSYHNIDAALLGTGSNDEQQGSERATDLRANILWHKNDRIKVARFFGKVPKKALMKSEPVAGEADTGEMVDAIVIMAGGVVVKANESPYAGKAPVLACQYEDVPHEIWGIGVGENNMPTQKLINAGVRLFNEGKGMALLGTKSVDRSKFLPSEDFKKFPGKVYQMKPGLSPEERQTAIIDHKEGDVTDGWIDMIRMAEQFSDDDTGITKYTQGDDSSNLNKTATGISMIMSASSLPIKEAIQNIDENWIEPMIERLVAWNLKYLTVETVEKLHSKEIAEIWGKILAFGKTSFMEWQATGTSSFMQKEILTNKLRAFADFAMSNSTTAPLIDARELLQQTWDCMEIGRESPILKEEDGDKIPPQVKQKMEQDQAHTQEMEKALHDLGEKFNELHAKSEESAEERRIKAYQAQTARLVAILPYMPAAAVAQIADELGLDLANDPELVPGAPQVEERMQEAQEPLPEQQEAPGQAEPADPMQSTPGMADEQQEPIAEPMEPPGQAEPQEPMQ